ncbi:MAG: alpha/beta hydrolase, partial [Kiritimatiellaceae bacterium]|nr:alpha/beta hydrolase [Kiritimatiellaceae bacterium]
FAPVVIYIHGGGWSGGERYVLNPTTFESFTERGIAVACISYRLAKNGVSVLDCLIDCKDAARFLAKQAKNYNLDPTRFATIGHSAGGHLTLCTALIPNQEALLAGDSSLTEQNPVFLCAVAQAPLVTLLHPEQADSEQTITMNPTAYERFLGGTSSVASTTAQLASNSGREQYISSFQTQIPAIDLAQFLSPECWITRSSPPILLIHGSTDTLISVRGSRYFKQIADERNTRVTYIEVENAWHDFNSQDPEKTPSHTRQELDQISLDFLIQNLLKDIQTK